MKKSLTIEDLKERIGKPVFAVFFCVRYGVVKMWKVIQDIDGETVKFTDRSVIYSINFEKNGYRFFDEEVSEEELKEILDAEEKAKKKTGYETVGKGENYFFITSYMKAIIGYAYHWKDSDDVAREACGNHFNDETLAINLARAESLKYQLRRYAALNGGIPSQEDWQNNHVNKYHINYDFEDNILGFSIATFFKDFGQIYFKSIDVCEKAIEIFEKELIWYFTEFEEQLY